MTKDQKTICMLVPFLHQQTGGMERQAWQLAKLLTKDGYQVIFLTCYRFWQFGKTKQLNHPQIKIVCFPGLFLPNGNKLFPLEYLLWSSLWLWLNGKKIDIIHAHQLFSAGLVGAFCQKMLGKPLLIKVAGSGQFGDVKDLKTYPLTRWKIKVLERAKYLIAINPEIIEELLNLGSSLDNVEQIPNGVDAEHYCPPSDIDQCKSQLGWSGKKVITFIGRLVKQKQVDYLIDIWPKLKEKYADLHLVIIGQPDKTSAYGQRLKDQAAQSGYPNSISFLGAVKDSKPYLQATDIFVLPSRSEGISNVLLEAASTALPLVISNAAGNLAIVRNKKNGLVFDRDNPEQLYSALEKLLADSQLAATLGQAARREIMASYSLPAVAEKYKKLYQSLV